MDEGPRPKVAALFFVFEIVSQRVGRPAPVRGSRNQRNKGGREEVLRRACRGLPAIGSAGSAQTREPGEGWREYPRAKKSRAHESFDSCALFQLSRKVFMLPGSICRENIPAPFSWQEVSPSFSVETCVGLCKSRYAEAFHRLPALRWRGLFFRS